MHVAAGGAEGHVEVLDVERDLRMRFQREPPEIEKAREIESPGLLSLRVNAAM
jgi:hypothetical protein